mmetsp:Transcript_2565/g.3416  ORF Transcript_2565/g.3416 Transcript_2565/m.3416 type:complete len:117 (+) Transcript_2565:41-391(+)
MKYRSSLRLMCNKCMFVKRKGRVRVICKANPRHKQAQILRDPLRKWYSTSAFSSSSSSCSCIPVGPSPLSFSSVSPSPLSASFSNLSSPLISQPSFSSPFFNFVARCSMYGRFSTL